MVTKKTQNAKNVLKQEEETQCRNVFLFLCHLYNKSNCYHERLERLGSTELTQLCLESGRYSGVCVCMCVIFICGHTELQEAFMLFDYNKSGTIYARDIGPVVRSVGLKPSQAEIRSIMADVQQNGTMIKLLFT